MIFESKFNFGDKVFVIGYDREKTWQPCSFCAGIGIIIGKDDQTRQCPDCWNNKGKYVYGKQCWTVGQTLTIGEIKITDRCQHESEYDSDFNNYGDQTAMRKEEYMAYETGIGSGSVWEVKRLFATKIEAQEECNKLNNSDV